LPELNPGDNRKNPARNTGLEAGTNPRTLGGSMSTPPRSRLIRRLFLAFAVAVLGSPAAVSLSAQPPAASQRLLFVHDSAKEAEPLLAFLKARGFDTLVVDQAHLPPGAEWGGFRAVLGYVHGRLLEPTEVAIIDYTKKGGRFVALHHMVSSGKAANKYYFDFMGLRLDDPKNSPTPKEPGAGYGWFTGGKGEPGIQQTIVNLNATHFITSHDVKWNATAQYQSSDALDVARDYPAILLPKAEAYVNVKFTDGREKTVLTGFSYTDPRNQTHFEQDRSGWTKPYGAGRIVYLQPGHFAAEYENPNISQMVLNAIIWDGR
jgi:hypothetical protein